MFTANLSKDMAQKLPFAIEGETWLISIRDRNKEAIVPDKIFKNVLFVDFNDINRNILKHNPEEEQNGITDKEAEAIADFILEAEKQEVNLFVNCTMGMCRSGGVVKILRCLHWELLVNDKLPDMFPNNEVRYAIQKFVVQKKKPNAN